MNADIISLQAIGCRKGNGETTAGTADERRYTQIEEKATETAEKRDRRNGETTAGTADERG